jgi:HAD superfamily phosphatase (TIGR01668 family)
MIERFFKTKHFIPKEFYNTFFDIDFDKLYQQGIRLILTDLDNTLISYQEDVMTKEIIDKFDQLIKQGFEVIIISNNRIERVEKFVRGTKIKGIGSARKPFFKGIRLALDLADETYYEDQICLIGDQLVTDIYLSNRYGIHGVLVNPIARRTEKFYTKMNRRLEERMLEKIARKHPKTFQALKLEKRR